jgi:hypothetical protein
VTLRGKVTLAVGGGLDDRDPVEDGLELAVAALAVMAGGLA